MDQEKVIVIDFGGQYNQLVARRVRECNVYCEIYSYKTDLAQIKAMNPKGIILTGGPNSCYEDGAPTCTKELFELGVPVLGLCYGAQLMQHVLGGKVEKAPVREYGKTETFVDKSSALFSDVSEKTIVWMSHFDYISQIAPGFKIVAHTADCPVAAAECTEKNLYAIQFHPEVLHTQEGTKMLHNFVRGVCGCAGTWKMDAFVENTIKEIREKVGSGKVLLALSGGVDSSYIASTVKPMKTYSVGFEVGGFDETTFSKDLCDILHMSNAKKEISSDEFFDALPEVQYHSDEPHANLSAVPLYYLSQLAAKDVKVVLSGEGADEMFGGYETYIPSKSGDMYRKIVPASIRKKLGDWAKHQPDKRGLNFLKRNATSVEDSYIGQAFIMDNEEADEVLSPAYKSKMRYQDVTKPYFDQVKDQDDLHKKLFLDMHLWLPHDILLKADKMTMAHSLELRVPYLDKKVWELARSIDSKYCVDGMETKKAFRTSALSHIPMDWAKRKKLGFLVPFRVWLREDKYYNKVKEMFQKDFVSEFFNQELLLKWLEDHKNKVGNYHRKIYTVYSFLLWYEQYFVLR